MSTSIHSAEAVVRFNMSYCGDKKLSLIRILRETSVDPVTGNAKLPLREAKDLVEASYAHTGGPQITMNVVQYGKFIAMIMSDDLIRLDTVRMMNFQQGVKAPDVYDLTA